MNLCFDYADKVEALAEAPNQPMVNMRKFKLRFFSEEYGIASTLFRFVANTFPALRELTIITEVRHSLLLQSY